jgi:DNA-binding response OmpR family regulator
MSTPSKNIKIAIIEDDIAIVQMYRTKFETEGYTVETAGDGATGLELVSSFKPDIILLDLMMPNVNGIEFLSSLRKNAGTKHSKVIVLTNMGDSVTATRVNELDVQDFIVKADMTPAEVSARIDRVLAAPAPSNQQ